MIDLVTSGLFFTFFVILAAILLTWVWMWKAAVGAWKPQKIMRDADLFLGIVFPLMMLIPALLMIFLLRWF